VAKKSNGGLYWAVNKAYNGQRLFTEAGSQSRFELSTFGVCKNSTLMGVLELGRKIGDVANLSEVIFLNKAGLINHMPGLI